MKLINLEFIVQKTPEGLAIFLPTAPLRVEHQELVVSLQTSEQLIENSVHRYRKDPYGVVRLTKKKSESGRVTEQTDFYKRHSDDCWIIFRPKNPEALTTLDLDKELEGQLVLGRESLEYWAFRALFSVGTYYAFPQRINTNNLSDRYRE